MDSPYTKEELLEIYQSYQRHRGLPPVDPKVFHSSVDHIDKRGRIVTPDAGKQNVFGFDDLVGAILAALITDAIKCAAKEGWAAWKQRAPKNLYTTLDLTDAQKQKIADDLFAYVTGPGEAEILPLLPGARKRDAGDAIRRGS